MTSNSRGPSDGQPAGFPRDPSEFDADQRVSFSRLDSKFILETDEGEEYEWDDSLRRWIPVLDQSLADQQSEVYRVDGVDESEPARDKQKKRKKPANDDEAAQKNKKPRTNTAVYVTSLPLDADIDEVNHVFSKCGLIAEEIDSGQPRIKMYEDDKGQFKGDVLVVYFRPESVNLAIQMLDDTDFRLGSEGPMGKMRVQAADYSYKSQKEAPTKPNKQDLKKVLKKTEKLNNKLADWDDDDPQALQETGSRWDKVVILKHMFTLEELKDDPGAILDIKEDIREECEKLGPVTNVVLFDKEPDGVASVRFSNAQAASACVRLMNGRWFDERQLQAFIATGKEKFKKSTEKAAQADEHEGDENEAGRLNQFGSWLEDGNR